MLLLPKNENLYFHYEVVVQLVYVPIGDIYHINIEIDFPSAQEINTELYKIKNLPPLPPLFRWENKQNSMASNSIIIPNLFHISAVGHIWMDSTPSAPILNPDNDEVGG